MRTKSLTPLKWSVARPSPTGRILGIRKWTPDRIQARQDLTRSGLDTVNLLHHVVGAAKVPFHAGAVIARDIYDQRVVQLACLPEGVDHAADFIVGLGHKTGKHFHQSRRNLLLIAVQ